MLCFSRDSEILQLMSPKTQMQVVLKGKQTTTENTLIFPPSGVIPFHGFTMYGTNIINFHCYSFLILYLKYINFIITVYRRKIL